MSALRVVTRIALALAAVASGVSPARAQAPEPGVTVTARVDRPAIWVADRVTYTIELACPRGFDIVLEDLGRDRLKLTGLDVVSTNTARRQEGDVTRYTADYLLTTYRVDVPELSIGSFPVRYYVTRAGQRPEEAAPAGSVLVPPVSVALRSLLPDGQLDYEPRDPPRVPDRWIGYRILAPVGIGLILVSMAPVAFLLLRLVRGVRARRQRAARPSSRHVRQAARAAFDEIRAMDGGHAEARRLGFARLDGLVRQHVEEVCGVAVAGLTPDEIVAAIEPCRTRLPLELVTSVLSASELARYAAPDLQPDDDLWRQTLGQAEELLFSSR
jgi:hypothetical protein